MMLRKPTLVVLAVTVALASACGSPSEAEPPSLDALPAVTNESPLAIEGTAEPLALVQVRGGAEPIAEASADAEGRFSVSVTLRPDAENTLLVSQLVDGVESPASTVTVTHDGTPPGVPSIDAVVSPTRLTSQSIRGSAEAGARVEIRGGLEPAEGSVDATGRFDIEVQLDSSASAAIDNELEVVATDEAGNESPAATVTITFDPNLAVEAPTLDALPTHTNEGTVTVAGSAAPGVGITIAGGATDGSATVGADGRFTADVGLRPNQPNNLLVFAVSGTDTSPSVAIGVVHDDLAPDAPEADPQASPTGAEMVRLTGLSEPGATVRVGGGAVPSMASAEVDGSFSLDVMLTLDTSNELSIVAEDLAGNTSEATSLSVVQDSSLEAPISVDPVVSPTSAPMVTLTGLAAASIDIEITGGASTVSTMSAASGAWSAEVTLTPNSRNELRITRPASGAHTLVVIEHDSIEPDAPMLNALPSPTGSTTVSVSGTTEPRARVSITGATAPAAATTGSDGRFSIDVVIVEDSETTLTAIATDRAGNSSLPSMASVTHSGAVPEAPTLDEINPPPTSTATYTVTGSVATPGADVSVLVRGGMADAMAATDPDTGVFAVDVALREDSVNDLSVVSVEGAIESSAAAVTIVHDGIAPDAPVAGSMSATAAGCIAGVPTGGNVAGSMGAVEARARVEIENVTGGRSATTTATDGGSFSVSLGNCAGDVIRVVAVDAAGNESASTEINAD